MALKTKRETPEPKTRVCQTSSGTLTVLCRPHVSRRGRLYWRKRAVRAF